MVTGSWADKSTGNTAPYNIQHDDIICWNLALYSTCPFVSPNKSSIWALPLWKSLKLVVCFCIRTEIWPTTVSRCNLFCSSHMLNSFFPLFCSSEGKFEEKEDSVPKLEQLNSLGCMTNMNLVLTKQNLLHMELLLLETFQWNLCLPTAAHFIDYYLSIAVHETDLHDGWPMVCLEKTKLYMAKYADYFLEVSLQGELCISGNYFFVVLADYVQLKWIFFVSFILDHAFLNYAPSLVATACVASSRIILRLSPTWPTRLHHLTAYSWDFLVPCIERLLM